MSNYKVLLNNLLKEIFNSDQMGLPYQKLIIDNFMEIKYKLLLLQIIFNVQKSHLNIFKKKNCLPKCGYCNILYIKTLI